MIHFFELDAVGKTKDTRLELSRDFDPAGSRWRNTYTLKLTAGGEPVAGKELELWFVERDKPGYDSFNTPLADRMKAGGEILRITTGPDGTARADLRRFDSISSIHHTVQIAGRFNTRRQYPALKPAETPQFEFYSLQPY